MKAVCDSGCGKRSADIPVRLFVLTNAKEDRNVHAPSKMRYTLLSVRSHIFPQDWERWHLAGVDGVEHAGKMPALLVRSQRLKKVRCAHPFLGTESLLSKLVFLR